MSAFSARNTSRFKQNFLIILLGFSMLFLQGASTGLTEAHSSLFASFTPDSACDDALFISDEAFAWDKAGRAILPQRTKRTQAGVLVPVLFFTSSQPVMGISFHHAYTSVDVTPLSPLRLRGMLPPILAPPSFSLFA